MSEDKSAEQLLAEALRAKAVQSPPSAAPSPATPAVSPPAASPPAVSSPAASSPAVSSPATSSGPSCGPSYSGSLFGTPDETFDLLSGTDYQFPSTQTPPRSSAPARPLSAGWVLLLALVLGAAAGALVGLLSLR